jgi:hypothetical protein
VRLANAGSTSPDQGHVAVRRALRPFGHSASVGCMVVGLVPPLPRAAGRRLICENFLYVFKAARKRAARAAAWASWGGRRPSARRLARIARSPPDRR